MKKLMEKSAATNWLLAVSVWCVMATTVFGAHIDPVEKALGEGSIEGTTLTVSAPVCYGYGHKRSKPEGQWRELHDGYVLEIPMVYIPGTDHAITGFHPVVPWDPRRG